MKVLHVSKDLGTSSGVGVFVCKMVAEQRRLGVEATVVSSRSELATAETPDLVHIHGLWLGLHFAAARWARQRGVGVVWSTHGMTAPWAMHHKWWKKLPMWWLWQRWALRRAVAVHCTTELEAGWNRRVGLDNCVVVPMGVDEKSFASRVQGADGCEVVDGEWEDERAEGEVTAPRLKVLFVGRIYPVKGLMNLVGAAAMVKEMAEFRIVGPDEAGHLAELVQECARLKVECKVTERSAEDGGPSQRRGEYEMALEKAEAPVVEFVGAKHGAELEEEYENCDVLVLPSFTENFGAVVVDALGHGKPVIASRFTPWKVLEERKCGWWVDNEVVPLAAKLQAVATMSVEERMAMGERGRALAAEYAWPRVASVMRKEYEKLVAGREVK